MEKALARAVRLDPLAVDDELWNGALTDMTHNLVGRTGCALDINLGVRDVVLVEKALCLAAIAAPSGGIHLDVHKCR